MYLMLFISPVLMRCAEFLSLMTFSRGDNQPVKKIFFPCRGRLFLRRLLSIHMENTHQYDELLIRYLLREANAEEEAWVVQWINADERNRLYFETLERTW